ncbi:MAG: TlyA family rRNA (cytidine-2'-O)-methyltransferase, partial [Spirochaetes bacterium]|nr:TlyA family rRNA (cytidine-2'-O)-methyltransferase [Spirochaetota bacterium]
IRDLFSPVEGVILLKPQFEAGPGRHDRGVVRAREDHVGILERVISSLVEMGMEMRGLVPSPIRGPRGNIEFLLHFQCGGPAERPDRRNADIPVTVKRAVEEAHGARRED